MRIFIVEDNSADLWLVEEAIRRKRIDYVLEHYSDAEGAIQAALKIGSDDSVIPDIMLVDFNLPKGNGLEVLVAISCNERLSGIPIAILTSSLRPEEVQKLSEMGANRIVNKPSDFRAFIEQIGSTISDLTQPPDKS